MKQNVNLTGDPIASFSIQWILNETKDKPFPTSGSEKSYVILQTILYLQRNRTTATQFLTT